LRVHGGDAAVLRLRRRQRLRRKEAQAIVERLKASLGIEIAGAEEPIDTAEAESWHIILVKDKSIGFMVNDRPFLTIRGLLAFKPERLYVTVDMGAVKFVYNGADIMAPGVVDADRAIQVGDLVWVRDEKNKVPLAIGEALLTGEQMIAAESGKAVKSIHHVGDNLWKIDEE
jgi:PUA-domain protein